MKYVLAKYIKNPFDENDSGKTIGVIVQSQNKAKLKFSNNIAALKEYDQNADITLFQSLEKSLKGILKSNKIITISNPDNSRENNVTATDARFLEDLHNSYQGKNQFSEIRETNETDLNKAISELYSSSVNL